MEDRKIQHKFTNEDIKRIKNSGLNDVDKDKLIKQAQRFDNLMVEQQKGMTYLEDKLGIGKTTISNYRRGVNFISESFIGSLSKEFEVSEDYLRGNADVKKIENETINELLGLNDNSIKNIGFLKNKELLNLLFDNDDIVIQILLDETKKFVELSKKFNEFKEKHKDDDRLEYNEDYLELYRELQLASFNMSQEYIRLISNNIK